MGNKQQGTSNSNVGIHPSVSFMLTRASHQNPNGIATIDYFSNRQRTWKEVHDRVCRLANGLKTKYNLSEGEQRKRKSSNIYRERDRHTENEGGRANINSFY